MWRQGKWIGLGGLTIAGLVLTPVFFMGGGERHQAHQDASCLDCHTLLAGVLNSNCESCHPNAELSIGTFHEPSSETACVACHTEHHGINASITGAFRHETLSELQQQDCESCHETPADELHDTNEHSCTSCHVTESWEPTQIDHSLLDPNKACDTCHTAPKDSIHPIESTTSCKECHDTEAWSPATFDHKDYFRFDRDHRTECVTCHVDAQWDTYTCYGCHGHSARSIRWEHLEEGIRSYTDCVECHRSGDEDEAKWMMRRQGRGKSKSRDKWGD